MADVPVIDENGNSVKDESGNIIINFRLIWEMIGTYQVDGKINEKDISYTTNGFMEYVSKEPISPITQS